MYLLYSEKKELERGKGEASVAVSADVGWRGERNQIGRLQAKVGVFYRVSDPH